MPVTRGGRTKPKDATERRCLATGVSLPKSDLVRYVLGPNNTVVPDVAEKLPGRGMWVTSGRAALEKAVTKKLFSHAAKHSVEVSPDLVLLTEALMARRVVELLSLARKGGLTITGFEKVKKAAVSGSVAVLLQAWDGSSAQKSRIRPPNGENSLISCLFGHELGLAFGRENVIHAALAAGGLTERIVEEASRLAGVRDKSVLKRADASGNKLELEGVEDE